MSWPCNHNVLHVPIITMFLQSALRLLIVDIYLGLNSNLLRIQRRLGGIVYHVLVANRTEQDEKLALLMFGNKHRVCTKNHFIRLPFRRLSFQGEHTLYYHKVMNSRF